MNDYPDDLEGFGGAYDGGEPNGGDANADVDEGKNLAVNIPTNIPEGDPNKGAEGDYKVPDAYANEGWAKNIKSEGDVYKMLAGAESQIGKQVKFPDADMSDEDRGKFFDNLKPENAGDYKFNREGQSDEMKAYADDKLDGTVKEIFHEAKLAHWQAELIQTKYEALLGGLLQERGKSDAEADKVFDDLAKKTFGDKEETVMATAKALIDAHTPEGFGDQLKQLKDGDLMAVSGLLNEIAKNYIDEGTLSDLGNSLGGENYDTLFEKGKKLMEDPRFQNEFDPDHDKVRGEVNEIFARLGKIQK